MLMVATDKVNKLLLKIEELVKIKAINKERKICMSYDRNKIPWKLDYDYVIIKENNLDYSEFNDFLKNCLADQEFKDLNFTQLRLLHDSFINLYLTRF